MLISAVVPVYNVEKYLAQCVESLLAQTWKDLEIILVDDGSTDSCGAMCDAYGAKYSHIKVVHKENAGLGMARNTGLDHAEGDYVVFVDSDDYVEPEMLEVLYNGLSANGVDVCKAGFRRFKNQDETRFIRQYEHQVFAGSLARTEFLPRLIGSRPDQKDSIEMCVWGCIYNMAPIREHGLRFPSERELISEDIIFNIDYMQHANGACVIPDVVYNYRMAPGSLTKRYRPDRFEACCHFYRHVKKTLLELGYDEMTLLRLHRNFFIYVKMCISQEDKNISHLPAAVSIGNIRRICADECVQTAIREYPVGQMDIRQKGFLWMVRLKMASALYLCSNRGII